MEGQTDRRTVRQRQTKREAGRIRQGQTDTKSV